MKICKISHYFIFLILLSVGCERETTVPHDSWGYFSVDVNGRSWEKTFKNAYQAVRGVAQDFGDTTCKRVYLYSLLFDSEGVLEEYLYLSDIPTKTGRYRIMSNRDVPCSDSTIATSTFTAFIDFDIFRDRYEVLESADNYLQIEQYQESGNREIKGRFEVTFVLRSPRFYNSYEDTLKFTNGKFHTKILPRKQRHL